MTSIHVNPIITYYIQHRSSLISLDIPMIITIISQEYIHHRHQRGDNVHHPGRILEEEARRGGAPRV